MDSCTRIGAVALAALVASCAVGPDYEMPDVPLPDRFIQPSRNGAQKASPKANADLAEWWKTLRDPELDSLVARAIDSNLDVEIALTRLQEARTEEFVIVGASLPAAGATGGGGIGTGTDLTNSRSSPELRSAENGGHLKEIEASGGFDATWELDLFGKFRRELEAVAHDAEALAAIRDWVIVTVEADVARAYLDMRALRRSLSRCKKASTLPKAAGSRAKAVPAGA